MSSMNKLIIRKKKKDNQNIGQSFILNLIDANKKIKNKNYQKHCLILEYNIHNIESFKNIEIFLNNNKTKKSDNNSIYLIGINFKTNDKILIPEVKNFLNLNKINHIELSTKNDNDILDLLSDLINLRKIRYIPKNTIQIILLGGSGAGKTAFVNRIICNEFNKNLSTTTGLGICMKSIQLKNGHTIKLKLLDTIGGELGKRINGRFIEISDFVLLLYDITRRSDYDFAINYLKEIINNYEHNNTKIKYLIGNKIDLENYRVISSEEAKEFCEKNEIHYFEISSKNGTGVDLFFEHLINEVSKIE